MAEIFRGHFELPELGFIGANGMAVPKDFEAPTAFFDDRKVEFKVNGVLSSFTTSISGNCSKLHATIPHSTLWGGEVTILLTSTI